MIKLIRFLKQPAAKHLTIVAFCQLACIVTVVALAVELAKADPAYLVIGTSPDPHIRQTIQMIRYGSKAECDRSISQIILHDTGPNQVTVTVKPFCTDVPPELWTKP